MNPDILGCIAGKDCIVKCVDLRCRCFYLCDFAISMFSCSLFVWKVKLFALLQHVENKSIL